MIVGRGMMARAFAQYDSIPEVLIFASGVSNSLTNVAPEFQRERDLLSKNLARAKGAKIVYFSTCSVYDPSMSQSPYVKHKMEMEGLITESGQPFHIFRLPQVVGVTTSNTIVNYLNNCVRKSEHFVVKKFSLRNLIDVEHVFRIADYIIRCVPDYQNQVINIASPRMSTVAEIVEAIEQAAGIRAVYSVVDEGANYNIDVTAISEILSATGVTFDDDYLGKVVSRYYRNPSKSSVQASSYLSGSNPRVSQIASNSAD